MNIKDLREQGWTIKEIAPGSRPSAARRTGARISPPIWTHAGRGREQRATRSTTPNPSRRNRQDAGPRTARLLGISETWEPRQPQKWHSEFLCIGSWRDSSNVVGDPVAVVDSQGVEDCLPAVGLPGHVGSVPASSRSDQAEDFHRDLSVAKALLIPRCQPEAGVHEAMLRPVSLMPSAAPFSPQPTTARWDMQTRGCPA